MFSSTAISAQEEHKYQVFRSKLVVVEYHHRSTGNITMKLSTIRISLLFSMSAVMASPLVITLGPLSISVGEDEGVTCDITGYFPIYPCPYISQCEVR